MTRWRPLKSLGWGLYGTVAIFGSIPASLFLVSSETVYGHLFGLATLCLLSVPFLLLWNRHARKKRKLPFVLAAILVVACVVALPLHAPPGTTAAGSCVGSSFPREHSFPRWSVWNLVPEVDQVSTGLSARPFFDGLMTPEEDRHVRAMTIPMYREMEAEPDFHALGSVMTYAYRDLFHLGFDEGHFYWYVPPHAAGQRLPAIVFLHGSNGNFKVYLWAWKSFADRNGFAIVCPSFGFGNWDHPGGTEAIEKARARAIAELDIDPSRVWLCGLSNGGLGVSRAALATPSAWRGLIYLSAVVDFDVVGPEEFISAWKGRPVLFLHGVEDDRVPWAYVRPYAERLSSEGVISTWKTYPGEDHFLFFSSREAALADVAAWIHR